MRVTLWLDSLRHWTDLVDRAARAERAGWDALRYGDRGVGPARDAPEARECWAVLGALAEVVPRIRLQALVRDDAGRHPAVVAKLASTVDQLSAGRLLLGLVPGSDPDAEPRLSEAVEVVRSLTSRDRTTFSGAYYQLQDAPLDPKPLQHPFPILLVGGSPVLAATHADHWSITGSPREIASQVAAVEEACQNRGRDRSTMGVSAVSEERPSHRGIDEWVVPESALGASWEASLADIRTATEARPSGGTGRE